MSEWQNYAAQSEPGLSREHQRVRAALLGLPKETCPVGFEFRLMKRISGGSVRESRKASNWILGWAGAGLGVAVAMLVAFTAFDFNYSAQSPVNTAGAVQQAPSTTVTEPAPDLAGDRSMTITGDGSEAVDEAATQLASTSEDSAAMIHRGEIPAGLDQTVSTNGGR